MGQQSSLPQKEPCACRGVFGPLIEQFKCPKNQDLAVEVTAGRPPASSLTMNHVLCSSALPHRELAALISMCTIHCLRSLLEDMNQLREVGCTFCHRPSTKLAPPASGAHQLASAGNSLFNMVVDTDITATKVLRYLNQGRKGQLTCWEAAAMSCCS